MKSKYNQKQYERTGLLRLYKNGIEIKCARYTRRERREKLMEMWRTDLKPLAGTATFHISIEPDVNP